MSESSTLNKRSKLYTTLTAIFLSNALLAEVIGTKLFSLEKTVGLLPASIPLFGEEFNFNLTAGVILWPVVFVTTDIINEYFGKQGVKRISLITVVCIIYAFFVFWATSNLSPSDSWVNIYQEKEQPLDIQYAFESIFVQSMGIIVASLIAFLIGQLLDAYVFHFFKSLTKGKMIWLRATGSTLVSQLVDSFVVLFVAFYLLGPWDLQLVLSVGLINYIYKFMIAVLLTPVIYLAHRIIDNYLGEELRNELIEKADASY